MEPEGSGPGQRDTQLFVNSVNNVSLIYSEIMSPQITRFSILHFFKPKTGN